MVYPHIWVLLLDPGASVLTVEAGCLCEIAVVVFEEERKGVQTGRGVFEHCSADKLMQQSRLSQQHTPSLATSLGEFVPGRGGICVGVEPPSAARARARGAVLGAEGGNRRTTIL